MKSFKILSIVLLIVLIASITINAQVGYYDAPYTRYEADLGVLLNATVTPKSYIQGSLQSEASEQICVDLSNTGASVEWTVSAEGDGLVVRYSIPDGQSGALEVYADNVLVGTVNLTSNYSWEYLATNGNPNNVGIVNTNPRMRFDEVRFKLPTKILVGGKLRLVRLSGLVHIDFAELESIPPAIIASGGDIVYSGDGSDLQAFVNANGGSTIFVPAGVYDLNTRLNFGVDNTILKGAGMWYAELHFTNPASANGAGGLRANANGIGFSGLYLSTVRNSRANSYKAINGVFTEGVIISDIWAEHFECGAWIGQYSTGPAIADGFTISNCRFRNNYADGINLCKGTRNAIVEHCSFRNNGDDDMAIWSANGLECRNNTFRYNTSENCWRSAGCAIYGGYSNKAHHLLIKDNSEVGLKVNNSFSGAGFNDNGIHEFHDITIMRCGTFNDVYNNPVGAIDLACNNVAGTRIKNVTFSDISIIDSRNDAIYIHKKEGEGFYNLIFKNVIVDGTGKEFPENNAKNLNWGRGYGILFVGYPSGNGSYCNITYTDIGGNATVNVNNAQKGTFSWVEDCLPPSSISITSGTTFGVCTNPITFTATATPPLSNTVNYVEYFVNNISIGQGYGTNSFIEWNNPIVGNHQVKAIVHYTPSNATSISLTQYVKIEDGIFTTSESPTIDGIVDDLWINYQAYTLDKVSVGVVSSAEDLSAEFRLCHDATNLYILVDVTDDILRNDGVANWQKDGIEIYIDMGNDKAGSYVLNDDYQFSFVYGISTPQAGVTFAQTVKSGNLGYIMEIRIPWATLNGLFVGSLMGFDIHVEDNDSGNRNGKKAWFDGTDNAWQSTALLGTLQIADCDNIYLNTKSPFSSNEEKFSLFPNPFQNYTNVKCNSKDIEYYSVAIKDINGKLISTEKLLENSNTMIGLGLPSGMYLAEIFDNESNVKQIFKFIKL